MVVLGAMLMALAMVVLASTLAPKKADAATQIVTRTFNKAGTITIPKGSVFPGCGEPTAGRAAPYPSVKNVGGFPQGTQIRDVNLRLKNYSHLWPDDVDVLLGHRSINRTVMSDVGNGFPVRNITLLLDDEANNVMPDGDQLVGGSFQPRNAGPFNDPFPDPAPLQQNNGSALTGYDGSDPNGPWRLFVVDDMNGECGKFGGGWSITIRAAVPR